MVINFFLQFQHFYSAIWLSKCLCEPSLAQIFIFFVSKNKNSKNESFRKNFLHIQKTNIKKCCDTPLLIYGTRCGMFFHFSTIIFRNAHTIYSNEQNLIVFSRVFWKYFCGIADTENTSAGVQKCFWNEQIPRNGCQDIIPKVIIPNAKITNAIIPNVT